MVPARHVLEVPLVTIFWLLDLQSMSEPQLAGGFRPSPKPGRI
jgi:hypothetical protein